MDGSKPVKQHPYRIHTVKQQILWEEVQYLLDNDFKEPSQSEWRFLLYSCTKTRWDISHVHGLPVK